MGEGYQPEGGGPQQAATQPPQPPAQQPAPSSSFQPDGSFLKASVALGPQGGNPLNPCAGINTDPKLLDYLTPRLYWSEIPARWMSPMQHIMEGHIFPAPFPNSRYYGGLKGSLPPPLLMAEVIQMNAATFQMGFGVKQGNGNISFALIFPDIKISTPIGTFTRLGIGKDARTGNFQHTNIFVVAPNCRNVVTSYPTFP